MEVQHSSCTDLFRALLGLQRAWEQAELRRRQADGLNSTDQKALRLLECQPAPSSGQLAAQLGLSTAGATTVLDRLEARQYATRTPDPADRRRIVIAPGPRHPGSASTGLELMRLLHRASAATTAEQRAGLVQLLRTVLDEFPGTSTTPAPDAGQN